MISLTGGAIIPAGTTTNVVDAVNDYFLPPVLQTLFQQEVVWILFIFGALLCCHAFVLKIVGWFKMGGSSAAMPVVGSVSSYSANSQLAQNNRDYQMLHHNPYKEKKFRENFNAYSIAFSNRRARYAARLGAQKHYDRKIAKQGDFIKRFNKYSAIRHYKGTHKA